MHDRDLKRPTPSESNEKRKTVDYPTRIKLMWLVLVWVDYVLAELQGSVGGKGQNER